MSFYLKKSLRFGPLRFNLSKSGIGVSAGVKGFRLGTGPRGNYIHAGRGGIYYRKTLGKQARGQPTTEIPPGIDAPELLERPDSEPCFLTDASSAELVAELDEKRKRKRAWPLFALLSIIAIAVAAYSEVSAPLVAGSTVCLCALVLALVIWDHRRKTVVLFYDLESQVLAAFKSLHSALEQVRSCSRVSHIRSTEHYADRKYHSGVLEGVERSPAIPFLKSPPLVKTNISIFAIPAGGSTLYFCPDRLLVCGSNSIGAVRYSALRVTTETCRFVESKGVFPDQQIVGTTWRYVNKDGGPDGRFRDNPQFPIVLYEELRLKSLGGLHEVYQFSNAGIATQLAEAIKNLGRVLALTSFWGAIAKAMISQTSEEGVWCEYDDGKGVLFRIASVRNESFVRKLAEIRASCDGPSSQPECALIIETLIGTILLDWRGLTHDGREFPFNADNARAVLSQSVELLTFVTEQAIRLAVPHDTPASPEASNDQPMRLPRTPQIHPANWPSPKVIDTTILPSEVATPLGEDEELVEECLEIIRQEKRASTSLLQRRLRLGYTRAARVVDILEQRGILGPGEGAKPREILVDLDAAV